MDVSKKVDFLAADGTGFKKDKDRKGSNSGEIRVVIGYIQQVRRGYSIWS